jgi:hypothetical protein
MRQGFPKNLNLYIADQETDHSNAGPRPSEGHQLLRYAARIARNRYEFPIESF